jgi:hypothetical protein
MKTRGPALLLIALLALVLTGTAGAARLTARDRAEISRTLDAFVNYGVKRHDVIKAYNTVTPQMRGETTRKQWKNGALPVYPFPARGTKFHNWTVQEVSGNEVDFQLILLARKGSGQGSIAFLGAMKKIQGRWLVDGFTPAAVFAPEGQRARVVGTNDFMPGQQTDTLNRPAVGRVNANYAFVPFAIFGLIILVLALAGGLAVVRHRRYVATTEGALPPLPPRPSRDAPPGA